MTSDARRKRRFTLIILAYPVALIAISLVLNLLAFGIRPPVAALPGESIVAALVLAGALLLLNHTWLMTSTELTRLDHRLHATPEEWQASDISRDDIPPEAWRELERRHNAHRNATENTVLFGLLAMVFSLASPSPLAAQVWIIGFGLARLGYTFSYLRGKDDLRGVFMSLSLLSLCGMSGYLLVGLLI